MSNDILGSIVRALVNVPEHQLGTVLDFVKNLASPQGDLFEEEGNIFLRKVASGSPVVETGVPIRYRLNIWKTIQIGGATSKELIGRVDRITTIGRHTGFIVRRPDFPVSSMKREVNLVKLSLKDLGFDVWTPSYELPLSSAWVAEWSAKNLYGQRVQLCEAEVAPYLFFELLTDERKLDLWMAMEPLSAIPPSQAGSILGLSEECGLHVGHLHSDRCWNINTQFVFKLENLPPPPPTALPPPVAPAP